MRQATEETMELAAATRYIIKRPRLTKLLDESSAKIKMLIAPAGYGKTTLAREWTSQLDVPIAWYECGHSAADLAAFSANVARAMQPVLPGVGESMIKALGSTYTAAENPEQLASLLAEDLEEWPEEAWLVVDDYHVAMGTELCEQFMDLLTRQRKLRILVCSRYRPGWATSRRILYGATLEMGQSLLAMTRDEATQTLEQRDASVVEGLLDAADGWPAVLGLAALAILRGIPTADIPDELHDYFAEELLDAATPTARDGLAMLAVADDVTTNLAKTVLGGDAHVVIREGCRVGFLASRAGTLYMHPLLRSFLRRRQTDLPPNQLERAIEDAVWHFLRTRSWDESFATIRRYNRPDLLVVLVEVAVDALLDTGRSSSLASWLNWGRNQHADAPPLDLAEAELSFRHGNYERAETLAIRAAKLAADNSLRTRALITAGRSASFRDRSGVALAHYADAEGSAVTAEQRRALLWGEVVETTYVDTDRGARLLAEYESLADGGITSQLRIAIGHLSLSAHAGGVAAAVRRARAVHSLLPAETDPLVRSSFLHSYSGALGLAGHYRDALEVADAAAQEVATNRLNFAIPHVKLKMALGAAGLRRFAHAAATLQEVQTFAAERGDVYLAANAFALEIRLLVSQGRADEALELDWEVALGAQHPTAGEALASRAIALACVGREGDARECVELARQRSSSLEPQLLAMGADAILAVRSPQSDAASAVSAFIERVSASGAFDPLVVTYRADPRILATAASLEPLPTVLRALVRRAKDDAIARGCGLRLPRSQKRGALSHREQDVLALIAEGLTNRSIAERLFISEATVKVHVQRIFEKLGVRSRTEAALRARAELELGGPE